MSILARTGTREEPIASYYINLIEQYKLKKLKKKEKLKIKRTCDVAKRKILSSFLLTFRLGLWLKNRFIAI